MNKKQTRIRRSRRSRAKIAELAIERLSVNRTPRHIYAQIIAPDAANVLVAAATVEKEIRAKITNGGNKNAAALVGSMLAERALKQGIKKVAFDRSGFRYHGRIKALADAAREGGIEF